MDTIAYDVLVMVTPMDFNRVECLYDRLVQYLPVRKILFVGSEEVGRLVEKCKKNCSLTKEYIDKMVFLPEDNILTFANVHAVMMDALKDVLKGSELPRGITGWYYQQFLKMNYANFCGDEYYLVWDGDTVPCKPFSMFREGTEVPYLDLKTEHHEEYFETLQKLLPGMRKCIQKSFIAEHMLMKSDIMKDLIKTIESNDAIEGSAFWEKIIHAIDADKLMSNSFSEFETYGTFVCFRHQNAYRLRDWHSFRYGGEFFEMDQISEDDYQWLGRDFFAISFEKGHFVREDHRNLFNNKYYQEKLSARQMLEICQQEFGEGSYQEVWDT